MTIKTPGEIMAERRFAAVASVRHVIERVAVALNEGWDGHEFTYRLPAKELPDVPNPCGPIIAAFEAKGWHVIVVRAGGTDYRLIFRQGMPVPIPSRRRRPGIGDGLDRFRWGVFLEGRP